MTVENIEFKIAVLEADLAARRVESVTDSLKSQQTTMGSLQSAAQQLAPKMSAVAGALNTLSAAAGQGSSELGKVVQAGASLAQAFAQGGPVGLAIATAAVAFGELTRAQREVAEASRANEVAINGNVTALRELARAARESRRELEAVAAIEGGRGSLGDSRALTVQRTQQLSSVTSQLEQAGVSRQAIAQLLAGNGGAVQVQAANLQASRESNPIGLGQQALGLVQDLNTLARQANELAAATRRAQEGQVTARLGGATDEEGVPEIAARRRRGRGGGRSGGPAPTLESRLQAAGGGELDFGALAGSGQFTGANDDAIAAEVAAMRERNALEDEFADKQRELGAMRALETERVLDGLQKEKDIRNQLAQKAEDDAAKIGEYGAMLGSTLSDAFQSAISGQESFDKAFARGAKMQLQQLGTRYTIEGVAALFEAAGLTILNPPAAAGRALEGAGKLALGLSLGGIGAAISAPPAGGTSAGQPTGSRASNDGARGGDTVVIYNAPVIDGRRSSDAEVGRGLEQYQRAFATRYGA